MMVVVRLIGGLANQMFPYATARRLAHKLGAELKLDISGFSVYEGKGSVEFRRYALGVFNIEEKFATQEEIQRLTFRRRGLIDRLLCRQAKRPKTYIKEHQFHFDPAILDLDGDVYLDGNWNCPKYFEEIAPILRNEFTLKREASTTNLQILQKVRSLESVSIHVRRGDYVANPKVNQIHGTCTEEYYRKSIDLVAQRVGTPHFFVFSDDQAWVRKNLKIVWPHTFVDHNGPLNAHEDLRLMTQCKHNIIANSGFSWWGAWLNQNPEKIIVCPRIWFSSGKFNTKDLIPEGWCKV